MTRLQHVKRSHPSLTLAALATGIAIVCGALLTLAAALTGGGSKAGAPLARRPAIALHGACTLTREDRALEQISLRGPEVSTGFCKAFASFLEAGIGIEEQTWVPRPLASAIKRSDCVSCAVPPACRTRIAGRGRGATIAFMVEAEEAYDELHYYPVYAHDVCELLDGRVEIERFIAHAD